MIYLAKHFNRFDVYFRNNIILFLDYDGTLTPLKPNPKEAILPYETYCILKQISDYTGIHLAVISGRSLKDVMGMVDIKNCIYAGNHGLEIKGPGINYRNPALIRFIPILRQVKNEMTKKLALIKGVFVEDKNLTFSIHYRLAKSEDTAIVKDIANEVVERFENKDKLDLSYGKKVIDIKPSVKWNKGNAVIWILQKLKVNNDYPIYIGDDTTDEDAFGVLAGKGLTIFIGRPSKKSSAKYYLKNTEEALQVLKRIIFTRGQNAGIK